MASVLIVDDDPVLCCSLAKEFEKCGFQTRSASDASQAQQHLDQQKPDVIVLDVMMPGQDGFAFLKGLKSHPQYRKIPVVMLTAKDKEEDISQGWEKGADAYLTKPFTKEEVILLVKGILKDRQPLRQG